jgi:hypothetical protein
MEWMLFDAMYPLAHGWRNSADSPLSRDCGPTGADLWISAQAYEFVAARSRCDKCGAGLGRKLDLAVLPEGSERSAASDPAWLIAVGTRCRGWRRHRHSAMVSEWRGGLRFGVLRAC